MADKAISELSPAASAADADELVINQSAGGGAFSTKRIAVSAFKSALAFAPSANPTFTGTLSAATAAFSDAVTVSKSANAGFAGLGVVNAHTGSGAYAAILVGNNTSSGLGGIALTGGNYTAVPNRLQLFNNGAGGIEFVTGVNQPIYFTQNNGEACRIDTNRYLLAGYTASQGAYKLQVNGTGYFGGGLVSGDTITSPRFTTASGTVSSTVNTWYNAYNLPSGVGMYCFWATLPSGASWCSKIFMIENGNGYPKTVVDGAALTMEIQFSGSWVQVRNTSYSGTISWGITRLS